MIRRFISKNTRKTEAARTSASCFILSIALCSIMGFTQHLAVADVGRTSLAPRCYMAVKKSIAKYYTTLIDSA